MSEYVLYASAVLALLNQESGARQVAMLLADSAISAVNSCEVLGKLVDAGMDVAHAWSSIELLNLEIVAFDAEMAYMAGALAPKARKLGLSLGDRCCIALGKLRGNTVVTAERAWSRLSVGINVQVIR